MDGIGKEEEYKLHTTRMLSLGECHMSQVV